MSTLREHYPHAFIVASGEDTAQLRLALDNEGFVVTQVSGPYPPAAATWSPSVRCLYNHRNVWTAIVALGSPAIIVEADFVPVKNFGSLPSPRPDALHSRDLAYLYACGPQLWDLDGGLRGHAGSTVAYCVSPRLAEALVQFADTEVLAGNPEQYSGWDSALGFWLNGRGMESFVPYRHYGEHGGIPNREHSLAGLRPHHRADLLAGRLAFLPAYAHGSRIQFARHRLRARCWGMARLLGGRYLAWHDFVRSPCKRRLIRVAIGRHLFREPPAAIAHK